MSQATKRTKIAVLGAGALGTALSVCIGENGYRVNLWTRSRELCNQISRLRENPQYHPRIRLTDNIRPSTSIRECTKGANIIFFAVPSFAVRAVARRAAKLTTKNAIVVSTAKGVEYPPFKRMSEVLASELPSARIAVISGPNFASELVHRTVSTTVIASENTDLDRVRAVIESASLMVHVTDDVAGVEMGAVMKGIFTIAMGIVKSMGVGDNTVGLLFAEGLREMSEICRLFGGRNETVVGPSGLGDWVASAFSEKSRNRVLGQILGMGLRSQIANRIAREGVVAEGARSVRAIHEIASSRDISAAITDFVYEIFFNNEQPTKAFLQLANKLRPEKRQILKLNSRERR